MQYAQPSQDNLSFFEIKKTAKTCILLWGNPSLTAIKRDRERQKTVADPGFPG